MSKIFSFKRDFLAFLGFVMLGIGMLCVGVLTSTSVKDAQLIRDGKSEAMRWADELLRIVDAAPVDAHRAFLDDKFFVRRATMFSRVFAFDVYDKEKRLFYSTGPSDWNLTEMSLDLLNSPVTHYHLSLGETTTKLHTEPDTAHPSHYASVVIPVKSVNGYLGSIVAFVEQSEQAESLATSFKIIAGMTGAMLLLAFGIFSYIVLNKTRDRAKAEERVRFLSGHDELTGLPNRRSFNEHLVTALEHSAENEHYLATVVIDVDRFKEINDAMGHSAGDSVLRYITELLKSNIRDGDFAARIGSDQFALALSSLKRPEQAAVYVATLSEALSAPVWINGEQIVCAVSIGAAIAPGDANDATVLMRHANLALGRAKADGGNTFKFFEQGMDTAFIRRRDCESDLRRAIDSDQFELHYQPQIDLRSETISGYEALIRWIHPRDGVVSPGFFIPLAEETELIIPIGKWVLHQACRDAAAWPKPLKVSVNLSAVQFKPGDFVDLVKNALDESGLDPNRLELEITESLLISSTGQVVEDLEGLRDLGVSIAMDDFGTGYSSLSYISSFPFNKIKIDKSFVRSMGRDNAIMGIVKCIIAMGRSLGVTITAEGVETEEQRQVLKSLGCTQAQGFLYGRPTSGAKCVEQMTDEHHAVPRQTDDVVKASGVA
ncbi:MAG: EAL domain-containing protein [Hyphomicrobiaceae bacterium]|nr:EAL domain-containing protein [Hyphomicrobiaceae bacterium]